MSANLDRVAAFMRDLADVASRELVDSLSLGQDEANEIGLRISRAACDEHRGELIYVPSGLALEINERDQAMFKFYIAHNRDAYAVAKHFDVSVQTAYKRIRIVEASDYARRQGALFDAGDQDS